METETTTVAANDAVPGALGVVNDNTATTSTDRELTIAEKNAAKREAYKKEMLAKADAEFSDEFTTALHNGRKKLKVVGAANKRRNRARRGLPAESIPNDPPPVEVLPPEPINPAVSEIARNTPEVRFQKKHLTRPFYDDELKIIAAALRSRTSLFRTADVLQCSYGKIKNAIEQIPELKELAEERAFREREETEEAIDACIKARVPAVVMWKAEKIMPEKYGTQVNLDNEDDTKLVIGALSEEDLAAADAAVAESQKTIPLAGGNAVLDVMEQERAAEMAAAGAGVPAAPLSQIPPAPAVNPPIGDPNFSPFAPASDMGRVDFDAGFSGGDDGFDDGFGGGFGGGDDIF